MSRRLATTAGLVALALGIEAALLCLDRISIHPTGAAGGPGRWIVGLFAPVERTLGAIPADTPATRENHKIAALLSAQAVGTVLWLAAALLVTRRLPPSDPPTLAIILVASVIFRLTLVPFPPILETDLHRYLWDGVVVARGINPYRYAPQDVLDAHDPAGRARWGPERARELAVLSIVARSDPGLEEHLRRVTHPRVHTIYPPVAQLAFGVVGVLAPGRLEAWKLLVAIVDLGILGLIVAFLALTGANLNLGLLYGWCPLVLKEYANTGHADPLAIFLVLVALWYLCRGRPVLGGIGLGLATLAKIYPAVLAIALVRRLGRAGLLATALTVALGLAPFVVSAPAESFAGTLVFARRWEFNSSLFALTDHTIAWLSGQTTGPAVRGYDVKATPAGAGRRPDALSYPARAVAARAITGGGLVLVLVWLSRRRHEGVGEVLDSALAAIGAVLCLSPVVIPSYVGWVLPLAVIRGRGAWLVWSATVQLYYVYFWVPPGGAWGYKPWVRLWEYVPLYGLLARTQQGR